MKVIRELFPGAPPPLLRVALYAIAALVFTGVLRPDLYRVGPGSWLEGYSILSMDLAMSRAFCGRASEVTPLVSVTTEVSLHQAELGEVPVRRIAADRAGSLERFCETSTVPRVNNENSLMWLDSWLWHLGPDLSIEGLGRLLHGIRVGGLLLVFTLMLANGLGVLVALSSWLWALILLQDLRMYVHHGYPFMLVLLLVTGSIYATLNRLGWTRPPLRAALVAVVAGAWSAFAANMRTSHLPVYVLFAIVLFGLGERQAPKDAWQDRAKRLALAVVLFVAGFSTFQYLAITRYLPKDDPTLSRHTILHSTVIGLGVPESDFSRREQITWSDGDALAIATRLEPGVKYLSADYERVLWRYYSGLWRDHTREMLAVYRTKALTAGKHMLMVLRGQGGMQGRVMYHLMRPLDMLPNGLWLLALYLVAGIAGLVHAWRAGGAAILLVYLSIAAVLLHLEASIVMSNYVVNYQSFLAFFCVFLTLLVPLSTIGALWDRVARR